jgi:hypothetical protein
LLSSPSSELQIALWLLPAPSSDLLQSTPTFNDILWPLLPGYFKGETPEGEWNPNPLLSDLPWVKNPTAWKGTGTISGKWRDMILVQPLCNKLKVGKVYYSSRGLFSKSSPVECPEGLRLGLLHDLIEDWVEVTKDPTYIPKVTQARARREFLNEPEPEYLWTKKTFGVWNDDTEENFVVSVGMEKELPDSTQSGRTEPGNALA